MEVTYIGCIHLTIENRKKQMKNLLEAVIKILIAFILISGLLIVIAFISQEKLIFFPEKLAKNHQFSFTSNFEEKFYLMEDSVRLHGLLFKADSSKGVVFYLHGNAGSASTWGNMAEIFTKHNYDLLLLDYRGYGKSEGRIVSEKQMYTDVRNVYNELKTNYSEDQIIVLGYSIGTGMASMIAAENNPKQLILLAPYFNLPDLVKQVYPIVPRFIVKYKFKSNEFLPKTNSPIAIFHGLNDDIIPPNCSERLYKLCKPSDKLLLIDNQGHNGLNENGKFQQELAKILD